LTSNTIDADFVAHTAIFVVVSSQLVFAFGLSNITKLIARNAQQTDG
jgi:hypothetical protein